MQLLVQLPLSYCPGILHSFVDLHVQFPLKVSKYLILQPEYLDKERQRICNLKDIMFPYLKIR